MNVKDKLRACLNKIESMTNEEVMNSIIERGLEKEIFGEFECRESDFVIYSKLNDIIKNSWNEEMEVLYHINEEYNIMINTKDNSISEDIENISLAA